jgi:hypothetical protein
MSQWSASNAVAREVSDDETEFFDTNGWVLLRGFLTTSAAEVVAGAARHLMGVHAQHSKAATEPFSAIWRTYDEPSYDSAELWEIATSPDLGRAGSRLLHNHAVRLLRDEIYVKMPDGDGEGRPTPWHQDFAYANRDRSEQVNLWIALDDIADNGGSLRYFSGSHRRGLLGRALGDPNDDLLAQYPELAELHVSPGGPLRRGDALAHHGLTVHGAPANTSDAIRWAYTVVLFHAGARYTGVPWPRRLAQRMGGIEINGEFDHPLTPVVWPTSNGRIAP